MQRSFAFYQRAVVLGLIAAIGAFAIDMYIPGFAAIATELHTDPGMVQLSMTSFFVALALGQVIYGPVSDATGRRPSIFAGLALFAVGCVVATFASSISGLIFARFVQGLGAAATAVMPMAVIRDEHTGPDAARLLSLAMVALSVSPILAPVFGGFLVQYTSWRLIFVVLIAIACAVAVMVAVALPETWLPDRRLRLRPLGILLTYGRLLRSPRFIVPILTAAGAQAVLFVFIAGAPFLFVTLHGVTPTQFGLLFALHAISIIGISQTNAAMLRRMGSVRLVRRAATCLAVLAAGFATLVLLGTVPLWPLVILTLGIFACLGCILAPAFLAAMEPFGAIAGAAAAIGAAVEFSCSSVTTFLMGIAADGTARPMALALLAASLGCLGLALVPLGREPGGTA